MLLGSQVVLEEQGGFGSCEEGMEMRKNGFPAGSYRCLGALEGRFRHVTSSTVSHSFSHPTCVRDQQDWGPCYS